MPREINLDEPHGSPYSAISALSTPTAGFPKASSYKNKTLFKSALPALSSDTASLRSSFLSEAGSVNNNGNQSTSRSITFKNAHRDGNRNSHVSGTNTRTSKKIDTAVIAQVGKDLQYVRSKQSFLSRSERFQKLVQQAFDSIDVDNSGTIDKTELYSGLILIHLNLAAYIGAAACRPVSKAYLDEIFDLLDTDGTGDLHRDEFLCIMTMLCSNIVLRVCIQIAMTFLIVPILAQYGMDLYEYLSGVVRIVIALLDAQEVLTEWLWKQTLNVMNLIVPSGIQSGIMLTKIKMEGYLPEDFAENLPITIATTLLGMLLVPWMLMRLDELYNRIATAKKDSKIKSQE